jgi:hypothetical protein
MVMGNAFSSREAVTQIKVIIWDEEPPIEFEMCLWEQNHIYMLVLQLFTEIITPPSNAN